MAYDFDTTTERSQLMKKIHSTDTKAEIALRKALWANGIRYRKNYAKLPGKPDIAIVKNKIAIFVDGEFWHGYNWEEKKRYNKWGLLWQNIMVKERILTILLLHQYVVISHVPSLQEMYAKSLKVETILYVP